MGIVDSTLDATLAGYTRFGPTLRGTDVEQPFPEVAGKHIVVTGSTSGLGRAAVLRLASNGAVVHAVGRSASKLETLQGEDPDHIRVHEADLSLMSSVVDFADRYIASGEPLHALINNVGVMTHEHTVTSEGFELTYATNLLGQYVLTEALLGRLVESAPSRVVMVASGGMYTAKLQPSSLQPGPDGYDGTRAYAHTKRGQVVLAEEWSDSLASSGISVNSMHPGWVDTPGVEESLPSFYRWMRPFLRDDVAGADTIVWMAASDDAETDTGRFFHDRQARATHRMKSTHEQPTDRQQLMQTLAQDAAPFLKKEA